MTSRPTESEPQSSPQAECWNVWRLDDNGNQYLLSGGHSRAEAERICADFEARGHKQLYWVSCQASVPDGNAHAVY